MPRVHIRMFLQHHPSIKLRILLLLQGRLPIHLRISNSIHRHRRIPHQQLDSLFTDNSTDTTSQQLDIPCSRDTELHNTLHQQERSSSSRWLWSVLDSNSQYLCVTPRRSSDTSSSHASSSGSVTQFLDSSLLSWPVCVTLFVTFALFTWLTFNKIHSKS